jgi:uncharacterized protein (TIGR03083 family)
VFLATADLVAPLLRTDELVERWTEPSALADFPVSGLAGHLARAVLNVERYLEAPPAIDVPTLDAVTYFLQAGSDVDAEESINRSIRERGEQEAAAGYADLAARYDRARTNLARRLPLLPPDQPILVLGGDVLPLDEYLLTRLIELVVHADDLAVSLRVPTPDIGDDAADLVITTLSRISRGRYGTLPVLRALSRRERGPSHVAAF